MAERNRNVAVPDGDQQGGDFQCDVLAGNLWFFQGDYRNSLDFAAQ